ncbi:hypothetical protein DSECCO2_566790 [anaerobic digester metagenome]
MQRRADPVEQREFVDRQCVIDFQRLIVIGDATHCFHILPDGIHFCLIVAVGFINASGRLINTGIGVGNKIDLDALGKVVFQ